MELLDGTRSASHPHGWTFACGSAVRILQQAASALAAAHAVASFTAI